MTNATQPVLFKDLSERMQCALYELLSIEGFEWSDSLQDASLVTIEVPVFPSLASGRSALPAKETGFIGNLDLPVAVFDDAQWVHGVEALAAAEDAGRTVLQAVNFRPWVALCITEMRVTPETLEPIDRP